MIEFTVYGKPETKGSARAFRVGNRCVITNANPRCKKWQEKVTAEAIKAGVTKKECVIVRIDFYFEIAKSRKKDLEEGFPHTQKPDIDKLIRPILDALTGVAYHDDCSVSCVLAGKFWADENRVEIKIK
jgi:Holliday junction resolvase RusA-like endonuclease